MLFMTALTVYAAQDFIILTDTNPDITISTGSTATVYGSSRANHVNVEKGANAELINFPGNNMISIESDAALFSVCRSGTVVTFEGTDHTVLTMPATGSPQTLSFNGIAREFAIKNNAVMLGWQEITAHQAEILPSHAAFLASNAALPDIRTFTFTSRESSILHGSSAEFNSKGWRCDGIIDSLDTINRLAIVSRFYQNGCYTDGRYNNNDYFVEYGTVSDAAQQVQFPAYTIHEPAHKASRFLASEHVV